MWELIRANRQRSVVLVLGMAVLLAAMGYAFGAAFLDNNPAMGLMLALLLWAVLALIAHSSGDAVLLSVARARRIEKEHHPVLFNVVEEMAVAAGLPQMPAVYIIDDAACNAFATGRSPQRASVAVTAGLLQKLDRDELQGVIAHELGHIKNLDVLFMTRLTIMMGAIVLLAEGARRMLWLRGSSRRRTASSGGGGQGAALIAVVALVLIILAPLAAQLLYFAASRRREYLADASAAVFTRYPEGLASALEKIAHSSERLATANRATAPLYIVNPLRMSRDGHADLTSTHPPISKRIKILRSMGGSASLAGYEEAFRQTTGRPVGIMPPAALQAAAAEPVPARGPSATSPESTRERVRATSDALWRLNDYTFIPCPCGTTFKVPPHYRGSSLDCPHCRRIHKVPHPPA